MAAALDASILGVLEARRAVRRTGSITKHLIFSAWNVVPDALAGLLSYEAERRIVEDSGVRSDHAAMPKRFAARLRFSRQGDGRLSGMAALMLMFPSRALVEIVDPLKLVAEFGATPTFDQVRQRAADMLSAPIESHVDRSVLQGPVDRRWYWVALEHAFGGISTPRVAYLVRVFVEVCPLRPRRRSTRC